MDYTYYWFIASILLFLLEAMGASGVGFLFAALGTFSVGVLLQCGLLPEGEFLAHGAAFFALTAFWALVLWVPMKKMRLSKPVQDHHDMIGRTAIVSDEGLVKGKNGTVRWSGTTLRARLAEDATVEIAAGGDELRIVDVDGSTLILAQKDYPLKNRS